VAYVAGYDVAMIEIELSFYLLIIATSYPATYDCMILVRMK